MKEFSQKTANLRPRSSLVAVLTWVLMIKTHIESLDFIMSPLSGYSIGSIRIPEIADDRKRIDLYQYQPPFRQHLQIQMKARFGRVIWNIIIGGKGWYCVVVQYLLLMLELVIFVLSYYSKFQVHCS